MTVEEEIKKIDIDITKLKIQFDLYFSGSVPKPPTDQRDAIDKLLKKVQFSLKSSGDRFLYNSVLNKFNAYTELWLKQLRVKEEGVHLHPLARRHAHQAAATAAATGGSRPAAPPAAAARRRAPQESSGPAQEPSWRIPTNRRDDAALKKLYDNFIAAKDRVGDQKKPSFDSFAREIARHTAAIKGQVNCDTIDFKIYSKDNKVSIKAKPLK
ncbi:MAG TPA: MXAN_5187 C-terminal domain-containing protein [Candidatus Polarisedimenticolia bacterium]|nr:MXAN_5187 C-terminal domain-containing protein [Candidatus Polarisedimenticolia bacterium]